MFTDNNNNMYKLKLKPLYGCVQVKDPGLKGL